MKEMIMELSGLNNKLEEIKDKLTSIEHTTEKRIYLVCESENNFDITKYMLEKLGCRFIIATCIDADNWFEILYHFAYDSLGCIITVRSIIRDRDKPVVESITPMITAAEWIEREIHDVMGIEFNNHPNMKRLILADDWPEGVYPMRNK